MKETGKNMLCSKKISILLCLYVSFFVFSPNQIANGTANQKNSVNILLLSIDTLRPDHLGCYGYKAIETPNIDLLAQNGILFTNTYSPVPLTLPSHVSIMTGQYPIRHGVQNNGGYILSDSAETLAEIIRKKGYKTGAIIASYVMDSQWGLDQGFDYYDDYIQKPSEEKPMAKEGYRGGKDITDSAKAWLRQNHEKPFFLWVHYYDPHAPYDPPDPFDKIYKNQPYDGDIAYMDQCLGQLLEEMKELSLLENTLIVLVGDHGEGLWEHQEQTHGLFIYNTTLRVPLIVSYPKEFPRKKEVASLVRTIDIMPTILEALDIKLIKNDLQGSSLIPLISGKKKDLKLNLYCDSRYPELNFRWAPLEGIVFKEWKYIQAPKPELYNLKNDPEEKSNLYSINKRKAKIMKEKLISIKEKLTVGSKTEGDAKQVEISSEVREKLQSLGYICNGGFNNKENKNYNSNSLPDPKDKIVLLAKIDEARELESNGQANLAILKYEDILKQDPGNIAVHHLLGLIYMKTGEPISAVNEMEKVAELDNAYFDCQNILGLLYDQLNLPEKAIEAFNKALKINPKMVYAHNNLGMVYLKMNSLDLAEKEFQEVIAFDADIEPIHTSMAFGNLGSIYLRQGHLKQAVKDFKKSINLDSNNLNSYIGLAESYQFLGNIEDSIHEWKGIVKMNSDDHFAYYKLGQLSASIGKSEEAIKYLKKSLNLKPDFLEAKILLEQIS